MSQPTDDDHDLNAFLAGDDDLSAMLRGLPQPAPSAELDQAILAQAALLLAQGPDAGKPGGAGQAAAAPVRLAANDALPGAANDEIHEQAAMPADDATPAEPIRHRPRWQVPLALAASVVLVAAVSLQLLHLRDEAPAAAAAALAQSPAAIAAAPPVVIAQLEPPAETAAVPAAKAEQADKRAALQAEQSAKAKSGQGGAEAATSTARAKGGADLAAARSGRQQLALNQANPAPATVSGMARKESAATAVEERIAVASVTPAQAAADSAFAKSDQIGQLAAVEPDAAKLRKASPAKPGGQAQHEDKAANSQLDFYAHEPAVAAAPVPAAPAAARVAPVTRAIASAPQAEAGVAAPVTQAADWLAQILVLEKTASKRQAGMEWRRFRKAYPDYPVEDALRQRLDALAP
ncbi:hypothetical protein IGB42_00420 [Andreprevotia sp. IGB-42]|uniref:hypothetical protein n=1 Tax=Andreprevotia sp. IGB-42 TaxID=2497473 RepID=UPI00135CB051|nr:hypothetical protein [Andreprevotia sp. IGB-42]KAF0815339.1 hypothetical protein IGB42_00420 [Andreprevotia sp. IGB-42]